MANRISKARLSKIYEYLNSDDLEMVQLGAVLLETQVSKKRWKPILQELFDPKDNHETDETYNYTVYWLPNDPKWKWKIEDEHITIERPDDPTIITTSWTTGYITSVANPSITIGHASGTMSTNSSTGTYSWTYPIPSTGVPHIVSSCFSTITGSNNAGTTNCSSP